jgi:hypothetical protein
MDQKSFKVHSDTHYVALQHEMMWVDFMAELVSLVGI